MSDDYREAALSLVVECGCEGPLPVLLGAQMTLDGFPVAEAQDALALRPAGTTVVQSLLLREARVWPASGGLYEARLVLADRAGEPFDALSFGFGVREVQLLPTAEGLLTLNGEPLAVKAWEAPRSGAIPDAETATTLAAAGANLAHLPGRPAAPSFYEAADAAGLLVWQSLPADGPLPPVAEFVRGVGNHPCLAVWSAADDSDAAELRELVSVEAPRSPWAGRFPDAEALPALQLPPASTTGLTALLTAAGAQRDIERRRMEGSGVLLRAAEGRAFPNADSPLFWAVRRALRPLQVSALSSPDANGLDAEVWLLNDGPDLPLLNVIASLRSLEGDLLYQENLATEAIAGEAELAGDLYWRPTAGESGPLWVFLEVVDEEGDTLAQDSLLLLPPEGAPPLPPTRLELVDEEDGVRVRNVGAAVAVGVNVAAADPLRLEDNCFFLAPGASRRLGDRQAGVTAVTALNAAATTKEQPDG